MMGSILSRPRIPVEGTMWVGRYPLTPKSSGAKIGGPITMFATGMRQPPGFLAMPRAGK